MTLPGELSEIYSCHLFRANYSCMSVLPPVHTGRTCGHAHGHLFTQNMLGTHKSQVLAVVSSREGSLGDWGSEAPPHSRPYPPSHSEHVGPCAWKASSVIIFSPMFSYAKNGAAERVTSAPAVCAACAVGPGWLGCGLWFMSLRGAGAAPAQRAF